MAKRNHGWRRGFVIADLHRIDGIWRDAWGQRFSPGVMKGGSRLDKILPTPVVIMGVSLALGLSTIKQHVRVKYITRASDPHFGFCGRKLESCIAELRLLTAAGSEHE